MSEKVRVHNPGRFEVVIDLAGHSLGGHTAALVERDAYTDALIASGALLTVPETAPAPVPEESEPVLETEPEPATARKPKRTNNTVTAPGNGSETGE